jgi:hypothetical protein
MINSLFYYPMTLHRDTISAPVVAQFVNNLPPVSGVVEEIYVRTQDTNPAGQARTGFYTPSAVQGTPGGQGVFVWDATDLRFRFALPYEEICEAVIGGASVDIYYDLDTPGATIPTSAVVYRNGNLYTGTTFTFGDNAVWAVLVFPLSVAGDTKTVNKQSPDITGNVTLTAVSTAGLGQSLIANNGATTGQFTFKTINAGTGLTVAGDANEVTLANAGVLTVNDVAPDVNGNVNTPVYSLPIASSSTLGGVKIGANVSVADDGTISVAAPYVLPVATSSTIGGVKQGSGISIAGDGTISATYALPIATASVLGGVKIGANVTVGGDGTISVAAPYTLPDATTTTLGGVIVGSGLSVTSGTVSANVTSVNGHEGAVVLAASDITTGTFSAAVLGATPGDNEVLITNASGVPTWVSTIPTANLPASILGAVDYQSTFVPGTTTLPAAATANKGWYFIASAAGTYTPPGGTLLTFAAGDWLISDGTSWSTVSTQGAVTSVSGQAGAVVIEAVNNNNATGTTLISDGGSTTGVIKLKTIVAGSNITLGSDANGNVVVNGSASGVTQVSSEGTGTSLVDNNGTTGGIATIRSLAAGSNITITPDAQNQTLTITANQAITPATTTAIGGVIVGAGLGVISNGTLSLAAPVGANIGGVKAGTGVSIAADGTISVTAVGGVSSVSGQTGAVVVQATDTSTASGTTLITNSGSTTANIQLRRIVAGSGITLSTDVNNNLEITGTGGYTLPAATTTTLGGVIVPATSGITVNGSGDISLTPATTTQIGGVTVDGTTITVSGGKISATAGSGGVTSETWGTSGALTGAITITAGSGISISNTGNTVQLNSTGITDAPNNGNTYARQSMAWVEIPPLGNAILSITSDTTSGSVSILEASPPANSAITKSLTAGNNVTLTDNGSNITITASIPSGTVSSVNGVAPSAGNVTLTAANVNALPISGGTMTGEINMGSQVLTGLVSPVNPSDAVPLSYITALSIDNGTF